MPPQTRDLIVTPLLKVIMPQRGRIDVSGRTGSIDVGTGGEKKQDYLLDAGAVIDVMLSQSHRLLSFKENLRNLDSSHEKLLEPSSCTWHNIPSLAQKLLLGFDLQPLDCLGSNLSSPSFE